MLGAQSTQSKKSETGPSIVKLHLGPTATFTRSTATYILQTQANWKHLTRRQARRANEYNENNCNACKNLTCAQNSKVRASTIQPAHQEWHCMKPFVPTTSFVVMKENRRDQRRPWFSVSFATASFALLHFGHILRSGSSITSRVLRCQLGIRSFRLIVQSVPCCT